MIDLLMGPQGGQMGLSFAAGAVAGWGFAARTAMKAMRDAMNIRITDLEERLKAVEDERNEFKEKLLKTVGLE